MEFPRRASLSRKPSRVTRVKHLDSRKVRISQIRSPLRLCEGRGMAQFPDEQSVSGEFQRQEDAFRDWITIDGSTPYSVVTGRYHLYVSLACPWASRTIIARTLLGLDEVIGMTVVDPIRDERGWAFRDGPGYSKDPIKGFEFL